ncbi:28542_t:CDS:2, partial [Racocetra persica]
MKTALSQMQIKIILCLANILKISIESELPYANDILNKSKKLIEILDNDTNRQNLRDIQQQIDRNISRNDEKLKENILSDVEFDICRELDIILSLFYELTKMLKGSKYPSLSFMTPAIENLRQRLNIYQLKNDVIRQIINTILDNLKKNFEVPSTLGLYGSFFDSRFKKLLYIDSVN